MSTEKMEQENQGSKDYQLETVSEINAAKPIIVNQPSPASNELVKDQKKTAERAKKNEAERPRYQNKTTEEKKKRRRKVIERKKFRVKTDPIFKKKVNDQNAMSSKNRWNKKTPEEKRKIKEKKALNKLKYLKEKKRIWSIPTDQATPEELTRKEIIRAQKAKHAAYQKLRNQKLKEEKERNNFEDLNSSVTDDAAQKNMEEDPPSPTNSNDSMMSVADDLLQISMDFEPDTHVDHNDTVEPSPSNTGISEKLEKEAQVEVDRNANCHKMNKYRKMTKEERKEHRKKADERKKLRMEKDPIFRKKYRDQRANNHKKCLNNMTPEEKLNYNKRKARNLSDYRERKKRILDIPDDQATPEELAEKETIKAQMAKHAAYVKLQKQKMKEEKQRKMLEDQNSSATEDAAQENMYEDDQATPEELAEKETIKAQKAKHAAYVKLQKQKMKEEKQRKMLEDQNSSATEDATQENMEKDPHSPTNSNNSMSVADDISQMPPSPQTDTYIDHNDTVEPTPFGTVISEKQMEVDQKSENKKMSKYQKTTVEKRKERNKKSEERKRLRMERDPTYRKKVRDQKANNYKKCLNNMTPEEMLKHKEKKARNLFNYREEKKRILDIPNDQATAEELARKESIKAQKAKRAAWLKLRKQKLKEEKKRKVLEDQNSNADNDATQDITLSINSDLDDLSYVETNGIGPGNISLGNNLDTEGPSSSTKNESPEENKQKLPIDQGSLVNAIESLQNEENVKDPSHDHSYKQSLKEIIDYWFPPRCPEV